MPVKPGFVPGLRAEVEATVDATMQAAFDGRVIHPLYSTWALVHHLEHAARRVLEPFLEPHEEGVGYAVEVRHLAPTPVGARVRAVAVLEAVEGNRVVCRVEAYNDLEKIAEGRQVQVVLDRAAFRRRIAELQRRLGTGGDGAGAAHGPQGTRG
ncbi:MAG TPA: thioesterase family protein [Thermaerobacter sp.]